MILAHDKCDSWEKKVNELTEKIKRLKMVITKYDRMFSSSVVVPSEEYAEFHLKLKNLEDAARTKAFDYSTGLPLE